MDRPPESPEQWQYYWDGIEKAHAAWPVVKPMLGIVENWKLILVGVMVGLALGGSEVLEAWGWIK